MNKSHYPTLDRYKKLKKIGFPKTENIYWYREEKYPEEWVKNKFMNLKRTTNSLEWEKRLIDMEKSHLSQDEKTKVIIQDYVRRHKDKTNFILLNK